MKISIIGTRGIPNNYGGFEQFAENISVKLVKKGHDVIVYNPSYHSYKEIVFFGVKVIKKLSPEKLLGPFANYIYDYLCLKDAIKRKTDVVLACGYTSSPLSYYLCRLNKTMLVSNMDGLEWKRSKWGFIAKKLILLGENMAVAKSDYLVADNLSIAGYLKNKFHVNPEFIPYGANIVEEKDVNEKILNIYDLQVGKYFLSIGRSVPENSFEQIIDGFLLSKIEMKLVIISNLQNKYAKYLQNKYKKHNLVVFLNAIYDQKILNILRFYSKLYFHGHSVGGTNPSLLEAMAARCLICAHDNDFNRSVLGEDSVYFKTREDIKEQIFCMEKTEKSGNRFISNNLNKIVNLYNWDLIADKYEELFLKVLERKNV